MAATLCGSPMYMVRAYSWFRTKGQGRAGLVSALPETLYRIPKDQLWPYHFGKGLQTEWPYHFVISKLVVALVMYVGCLVPSRCLLQLASA